MKEYCKQCGKCCTPCIALSPQEINRYVHQNFPFFDKTKWDYMSNDFLLIYSDMTPISYEKACKLNPEMKNYDPKGRYFFKCSHLMDNNKCDVHDKLRKGGMCDGYPFYEKKPHDGFWYVEECGYKECLKENDE